jgi:hypothetical protein
MMKRIFMIFVYLLLAYPFSVWAACTGSSPTWVSSADSTSINSCISQASPGDTINVQSGTFSWSPTLSKRVSIIGGYGGGTTTINGRLTFVPTVGSETYILRVSNFTINGGGGTGDSAAVIEWGSGSADFNLGTENPHGARLDHCTILNNGTGNGVSLHDTLYGVIDHNTFGSSSGGYTYVLWNESGYRTNAFGISPQSTYAPGMAGSGRSTYFEDNIVYVNADGRLIAHNVGGRTCFRYNTIHLRGAIQGVMDIHGTQGSDYASAWGVEFYGNIVTGASLGEFVDTRSGNNTMFYNSGPSNGGFQMYWGTYMSCPTTAPNEEMIHDAYHWNNRANLTGSKVGCYRGTYNTNTCGSYANRPLAGRDYFDDTATSPGISEGTLAALPGTCTTGQGYWATDQTTGLTNLTNYVGDITTYPSRQTIAGTLYKCTATNVWTAYYTPYTYPHPLQSGSTNQLKIPGSPQNFRVF